MRLFARAFADAAPQGQQQRPLRPRRQQHDSCSFTAIMPEIMQRASGRFGLGRLAAWLASAGLLLATANLAAAQSAQTADHAAGPSASSAEPAGVVASIGPAPLVVDGLGRNTVTLDGTWQFHLGDDPAWASPGFDDSLWLPIRADKPWGQQGHFGYTGYAWYRRRIVLVPVAGVKNDLALFIPPVEDAYEVYWNGALVGRYGKLPPHPVWYGTPSWHAFNLPAAQSGAGVLALRVWKAPTYWFDSGLGGGLSGAPSIGSPEAIAGLETAARYAWLRGNEYQFGLMLLSGVIALLALLAWLRNRGQKVLLWLAVYAAHPIVFRLIAGIPGFDSFRVSYGLIGIAISVEGVAVWFLLLYLLGLDRNPRLVRWTRVVAIAAVASSCIEGSLSLFQWSEGPAHLFLLLDAAFTVIPTVLEAWGLVLIPFAFRKRLDAARWIVAISALLTDVILAARNITGEGVQFTRWTIGNKLAAPLFTIAGNRFDALTIANTLLLLSIVYAVWRHRVEQSQRQNTLEQEYRSAQELQQVLIPESLPALPGYAVTSAYRPAQQVGGDFFQLIALPGGSALLIIGDVSGKGLRAAMTVSLIVGSLRSLAETTHDPSEILAALNRRLHGRLRGGFVTCLALRLQANGACTMANAGHLAPLLNGKEISLPGALPLALIPEAAYETTQARIEIGDRLTVYTDGLIEARNAAGELFGFARAAELIAAQPDAREAAEAAARFGQEDDITVLTVARVPVGVEATTILEVPALAKAQM